MATIDLTVGGAGKLPANQNDRQYVLSKTIDFSLAANALAQNDIAQVLNIPAHCFVHFVGWEVHVAEGVTATFDLGDGADPNGFSQAVANNANAVGNGCSHGVVLTEAAPNTVGGYQLGKYYAAADTIDLVALSAGGLDTAAKITITAKVTDLNVELPN